MSRFNSGRFQPQYLWNRFVFYLFQIVIATLEHALACGEAEAFYAYRTEMEVGRVYRSWPIKTKELRTKANDFDPDRPRVIMGRYYDHKVFYTFNYETVQRRRGYGIEIALTCHKDFSHSRIAMYIMVRWTTTGRCISRWRHKNFPSAFVSSIKHHSTLFFLILLACQETNFYHFYYFIHGVGNMTQKSIGYIKLEVAVWGLLGTHKLEVVDFRPSVPYVTGKALDPHEKVVPSSYHQCKKYSTRVTNKIIALINPFF